MTIQVDGFALSVEQYGYVFPDIKHAGDDLAKHYRTIGERELRALLRIPNRVRVAECRAQQVSDYTESAPSAFARYQPATSNGEWLNVVFSHTDIPEGKFGMSGAVGDSASAVLYLNTRDNDWYQHGIPYFARSLGSLATIIRRIMWNFGHAKVRCIGSSMGGYAAIVAGGLLKADQVVAADAELRIGEPHYRSSTWNKAVDYGGIPKDIVSTAKRLGSRLTFLLSVTDPMEARTARLAVENGIPFIGVTGWHGSPFGAIHWQKFLADEQADVTKHIGTEKLRATKASDTYERSERLFVLCRESKYESALALCTSLLNEMPELHGYAAVLSFLIGDEQSAKAHFSKLAIIDDRSLWYAERALSESRERFGISLEKRAELRQALDPLIAQRAKAA